jgi:hypothetical protein
MTPRQASSANTTSLRGFSRGHRTKISHPVFYRKDHNPVSFFLRVITKVAHAASFCFLGMAAGGTSGIQ